MRIRGKLLVLLLVVSLLPLLLATVLQRGAMNRLGNHLAGQSRQVLTENAHRLLLDLVEDYGRIFNRGKQLLELAVDSQAREIDQRLAVPAPDAPQIAMADDFAADTPPPYKMVPSDHLHTQNSDGEPVAVRVTYEQQVNVLAEEADRSIVDEEMASLSAMPEMFRYLHGFLPRLIIRQHVTLESGLHVSYPGHGSFPAGYDPRRRDWYLQTKEAGALKWFIGPEVATGILSLLVAQPVHRADGSFTGVTAIDVPLSGAFRDLNLPGSWLERAEAVVAWFVPLSTGNGRKLQILLHNRLPGEVGHWKQPEQPSYLESSDEEEYAALLEDVAAGRAGVREMHYHGRMALWAYGSRDEGQPLPVVIVPRDRVVAEAVDMERYMVDQTLRSLEVSGVVLVGVLLAAVSLAVFGARSVTRPVSRLAGAAGKLAEGDFDARVQIASGDEIEELGHLFNELGPRLQERERMVQAMALAREVQQHLLPQRLPAVAGVQIAGSSRYCEETGGDYYDVLVPQDGEADRVALVVGDVSGHGLGAALLMASTRGVLQAAFGSHGFDLEKPLAAINRHMVRDCDDAEFMTLFYGVFEIDSRTFRWNSAGHGPVFRYKHSGGSVEELPPTGLPLGIVEDATHPAAGPETLGDGDVVVIGTDGLWEARNADGEMFGAERLHQTLRANAKGSAEEIHAAVIAEIDAFCAGQPPEDDRTLLVFKVGAAG